MNTEWFSVQDSVIHAREMLQEFQKAEQHPKYEG
jgi:hypothetical protein